MKKSETLREVDRLYAVIEELYAERDRLMEDIASREADGWHTQVNDSLKSMLVVVNHFINLYER